MGANDPKPPKDGASLRISYLFAQFPVATQTFAVSDIMALRALGHEVTVHTIKWAPAGLHALLERGGVPESLNVARPSVVGALRWPWLALKRRKIALAIARRIWRSKSLSLAGRSGALLTIPRILEVVEEIARHRADVVHVFWSRHAGMVLPVLAAEKSPVLRSAFVGAYDLVADDVLAELTLENCQVAFTHAEANRGYVANRVGRDVPVHVVHRGIPLLPIEDGIEREPDLWLTASALTVEKNVEGVLKAFSESRRSRPSLRLEIYGEGPDRARLEAMADAFGCKDAVLFGGHVDRRLLFRHMLRAGVFLLLSKKPSERLPNVVKEAMWAGCAVVSSNSEGIRELVPDEEIGHVVDADDFPSVMTAIHAILSESESTARQRRARARARVESGFSAERNMSRYVSAWHDSLATNSTDGTGMVLAVQGIARASAAC